MTSPPCVSGFPQLLRHKWPTLMLTGACESLADPGLKKNGVSQVGDVLRYT